MLPVDSHSHTFDDRGRCFVCGITVRHDFIGAPVKVSTLSPLAQLCDAIGNDLAALDLFLENEAPNLTGDECCELAAIVGWLKSGHEALRDAVQAREKRLGAA